MMTGPEKKQDSKRDVSFLRNLLGVFSMIVILAAYPLVTYGTHEIIVACLGGAAISYANAIAGYFAIEYAFDRSFTTFMKAVLGGMGIRMLVSAIVLVVLITVAHMHVTALITSLMVFYAVNLTLEIVFLQKKMDMRTRSVR